MPPVAAAGDYVRLRAEMHAIVVFSACPMDIAATNAGVPKDVALGQSRPQHLGGRGSGETRMLSVADPWNSWLSNYGGSLELGLDRLTAAVGTGFRLSGK